MAGDVIDSLSIELNSNATKANKSVDELIGKLGNLANSLSRIHGSGLSGLANGVGKLANSMQEMKGIGEAKFQNLANGINKLSTIDTAGLNKSASSLYQITKSFSEIGKVGENTKQIATLASNLSKLGNKGVSNAIANIPQLAIAMKNLMTTLSTAPRVSNNLIQMTTALADLASQGQKASGATKGVTSAFKTYNSSTTNATHKTKSLASMFGRLYANFFWLKRGADGLKDAVESSMGYIETLNYFDTAFGQVADTAVKDWKKSGYKSADEYYNSFSERAKKVTSQMSGFNISPTGTLEPSGKSSLGIDPNQLMNYQATFGQMSSSIGATAEQSLKLSNVLTKIGADLASVKNMDFKKTWNDMASGLAGMSRTLDKYGVNIRNVNLQQQLSNIGIQANIQNLNQNEKALLRTIILLNSTKYAYGDLAETINQPANQVRLLQANFQNLARTIGNLFLPVVAKILPYINGLVIALQELFGWIGKSLGIDMSKITSSVGDGSFDMSELADNTDDVANGLDDASKKAKKLKNNINTIGIDKLNIISKDTDTKSKKDNGVGLGKGDLAKLNKAFDDAYNKYLKVWDKAFKGVDNKAQKIANRIIKAFRKGDYEGIGEGIGESITKGLNKIPWEKVYQGGRNFGKNFASFLNGLISPELFGTVGKTIAGALNTAIYTALSFGEEFNFVNLGESIANGINNFFETYDFEALAETINVWAKGLRDMVHTAIKKIKWSDVLKGIGKFIGNIDLGTIEAIIELVTLKKVGKWILSGSAYEALKDLAKAKVKKAFKGLVVKIGAKFGLKDATWTALKDLAKAKVGEAFANIAGTIKIGIEKLLLTPGAITLATSPNAVAVGEDILYKIESSISKAVGEENYQDFWANTWSIFLGPLSDEIYNTDTDTIGKTFWKKVGKSFQKPFELTDSFSKSMTSSFNEGVLSIQKGDIMGATKGFLGTIGNALGGSISLLLSPTMAIGDFITETLFGVKLSDKAEGFAKKAVKAVKKGFEGMGEFFSGIWDGLTGGLVDVLNGILGGFEGFANGIIDAFNWVKKSLNSINIEIPDWVPGVGGKNWGISLGMTEHVTINKIKGFATGGFPEMGELFIANEKGPELIGTMNGKTAVAPNSEITGIVSAINQQREEQNRLLMQQNQYLMKILEKDNNTYLDGKEITQTVNRNNARKGASMLGYGTGY